MSIIDIPGTSRTDQQQATAGLLARAGTPATATRDTRIITYKPPQQLTAGVLATAWMPVTATRHTRIVTDKEKGSKDSSCEKQ
jgi:hypothetical protein